MQVIIPFIIGIIAATAGTLLPGLLNATVVGIASDEGKKNAQSFIAGCLSVIFLQTYLAIFFAKIIDGNANISNIIQEVGLGIFIVLTIFFLIKNKKTKLKKVDLKTTKKTNRFYYGMLLALINVFPIPYYVFISITASNSDLFIFKPSNNIALSTGVIVGTYLVFRFYIRIFKNKSVENNLLLKNINLIIAAITGFIALMTLYKLIPNL
ncbi:hypothetical protein K5I29_12680 [Flavobacterium agricola]|uniref:Threonine/homoserine/homoserine lactone efflux protein n=1 Tax=Flavobacterium agricola TaxID=2870839 RepID=A0ABY6LYB7_9FLAO|nr:hypothetical protein [Flavobacterium agricola]UYW01286.1 hypothetical protein K5I29_12680 [Flavobacterium agricola]